MCVLRFILVVAGLVQVSGATPQQDGQDVLVVSAGHDNTTGRQYYGSVPEAEMDVPQPQPQPHPQPQVNASQIDVAGFDSADFEDADEVDEGMEEFFLENGFVEINNDDFYDYSYTPKKPVPENFLDESSIKENDAVEEDKPVEKAPSSVKDEELAAPEPEPELTTVAPLEDTTEALTESPMEEEPAAVGQLDPDLMDHIIPAFVHPINRPSNEWPLNMTQIGNPSKRKPTARPPVRRRRPQGNRRPQQGGGQNKRRRRRRKPQKGIRRPVVLQGNNNKNKKKNRNKNKRPAVGFAPNNLNYESIHKFFASRSCVDCQCGVTTTRRIVGGTITAVNEFPWMALIAYNGSIQCGGTLINDRFVLTAAHCVRGFAIKQFQIRFLEYNRLSSSDTTQVIRRAANIYSLDTYKARTADNDIAAIRLSSPISFATTTVRPICIPKTSDNFVGATATVAGWGATSENGRLSNILRKAKVPILSNAQCQLVGMSLTKNMLCAGRILQGGIDACQGDSGGPLMVVRNKRYYLAGIVSWGDGCARPKKPGVYTRVTRYLPWVQTFSTGSCSCY